MAKKENKTKVILASGKRKSSVARVRLLDADSETIIRVNGLNVKAFANEFARDRMLEPLTLLGNKFKANLNIKIKVIGGGWMGQADAIRIALARALSKYHNSVEVNTIFNEYDKTMISGDVRRTEPKKFGGRGARARFQKSYR